MTSKPIHPMVGLLDAGYVQKDKKNTFHGYAYASDEAVSKKVRDAMREHNLYVKSFEIVKLDTTQIKINDKTVQYAVMHARFMFADDDGNEYGPYDGAGSAADKGDKAVMRCMTAARKYAISQAALISWGDDPEANKEIDELSETEPEKTFSDAARKILGAAERAATEGLEAVKAVWNMADKAIKEEIKGTPEWTNIKKKAEQNDGQTTVS
jgi:hypothetical protein